MSGCVNSLPHDICVEPRTISMLYNITAWLMIVLLEKMFSLVSEVCTTCAEINY